MELIRYFLIIYVLNYHFYTTLNSVDNYVLHYYIIAVIIWY